MGKTEAYEYLGKGYSVFPLKPKSKEPAVRWARFYSERATDEDVRSWPEDCNLAITTGKLSGLVVVDFDPAKGGSAHDWLEQYPTDMLVETGSGGWHAYYQYPKGEDIRNATGFLPGVDIRAEGGYVVAPPSIHPNGQPYRWQSQGTPAALPDLVRSRVRETTENGPGWVSDLLKGVDDGGRDDACAKLAGWMAHKGLGSREALGLLSLWNSKNHPPLHISDIEKTVKSVYRTTERNEKKKSTTTSLIQRSKPVSGFDLQRFGAYMAEHSDNEVPWIIRHWLPSRTIAFAISPPGTYKTWSILDLAISVSTKTPFLGMYPVEESGPVILIQQEDYHGQTVDRLSVIAHNRFDLHAKTSGDDLEVGIPPDIPIFVHTERRLRFDDATVMAGFTDQIKELQPKLVIIDPLYSVTSTEDFMAKTAEDLLLLKALRDEHQTSFFICHHTKKGAADGRERSWGSQFLNAALETGWQISSAGRAKARFTRHFKSAANPEEVVIHWDIRTEDENYVYRASESEDDEDEAEENRPPRTVTAPKDPILKYLWDHKGKLFTQAQISEGAQVDKATVSRKIKILAEKNNLTISEGTKPNERTRYGYKPEF